MPVSQVRIFLDRAQDFLLGMQLLREDDLYRNSSALLGIHAAVAYTDALRVGLGDESLAADDHQGAVSSLRQLVGSRGQEVECGLKHLRSLVSKKSAVAYGKRRLAAEDYQLIFTQAERYAKWANAAGGQLKIEGWTRGDE